MNEGCQKSDNPIDTQKSLARIAGVGHETLCKAKLIVDKAPEIINKPDDGKSGPAAPFAIATRHGRAFFFACPPVSRHAGQPGGP